MCLYIPGHWIQRGRGRNGRKDYGHLQSTIRGSWSRWWMFHWCLCCAGRCGGSPQPAECHSCIYVIWPDLRAQFELPYKPEVYIWGVPENPDGPGLNQAFPESTDTETEIAPVIWLAIMNLYSPYPFFSHRVPTQRYVKIKCWLMLTWLNPEFCIKEKYK